MPSSHDSGSTLSPALDPPRSLGQHSAFPDVTQQHLPHAPVTVLPQGSSVTWTGTLDTLACEGVTLGQWGTDGGLRSQQKTEKRCE